MNKITRFFSLESLQQFASEHTIRNQHIIRPLDKYEYERRAVLNVAGFSEVIPMYEIIPTELGKDEYVLEHMMWILRIIPTGELFRISEISRGKFRLFMFEYAPIHWRDRDFHFDMQEPNLIGKATEKKISAWIDFLHLERTARANYVNANMCRNRAFAERVRAKYPSARFDTAPDGWTSEIRFDWDRFHVHYTAGENGNFYRHIDLRPSGIPTDEEILN